MHNKSLYTLAGALLLAGVLLASCSKEKGGTEPAARSAITIEAAIGTPTKVTYNGDAASFAAGDQVSLYAWMGSAEAVPEKKIVDGVLNTFDGTVWTPETQMLWSYVKENHYFLGIYPARIPQSFIADPYTLGEDLMIATELDGIPFKENAEPVKLTFTHAMAKLNVNLRFRNQWEEIPEVSRVSAKASREYTVNYLTKKVTATGGSVDVSIPEVTAVTGHDRSFSSLMVPQDGVTKVSVLIGGNEFVFTAAQPISLESGKVTTLNLYVGRDKIELDSVTVNPWVDHNPIQGGEAVVPVTEITFKEGTSRNLNTGDTFQLTPVFAPEEATATDCTWTSQNPDVATVDQKGLVTAVGVGATSIECRSLDVKAQFSVTVTPAE